MSGNIEAANNWCARTSNDAGWTLAFPAGSYAVGTANLVFNAVGLTEGGSQRPVTYHIYGQAQFNGTLGTTIEFSGPTIVDTKTKIFPFLTMTNVINTEILPEWWGALGDGATDDGPAFEECWKSSANGVVLISNIYNLVSSDIVYTTGRTVKFLEGSQIILDVLTGIDIAGVIPLNDNQVADAPYFTGDLSKLRLRGTAYRSSWFDMAGSSDLDDLINGTTYTFYTFHWDESFTFDANFSSSKSTVHHIWC